LWNPAAEQDSAAIALIAAATPQQALESIGVGGLAAGKPEKDSARSNSG